MVSVWSRVVFDTDGRATEFSVVDEEKYPSKFIENVKLRIAKAKIEPPKLEGQNATLRTGVELQFKITPTSDGGTVKIEGIRMAPLPTKRYLTSYPRDVGSTGGWKGEVTAVCKVNIEGRCGSVELIAVAGIPESVRRFAKASFERWQFETQRLNGQPIEGEYRTTFALNTTDDVPEDFRQDKFQRMIRGR